MQLSVPLSRLVAGKRNPRRVRPGREAHRRMVALIRSLGLIQPLVVRPLEDKPKHFRVIAGKGSKLVREYLEKWGYRVVLHYLPNYSPDANPIERVWWRMHERVTRNHRCPDLDELMEQVFQWLEEQKTFNTESRFYPDAKAA